MRIRTMSALKLSIAITSLCFLFGITSVFADTQMLSVSVKPLSSILIESKQSTPASVVSLNTSVISAEITGRAFKIYAETGDTVEVNQKLVVLDCRSYDLAKKQAEASLKVSLAQLNLAKKQLVRNQKLISKGTIARELLEGSQAAQQTSLADIELKKAQIATAKLAIDRCTIRAPFTAQISNKMVQQGQLLMPGSNLFELIQSDRLEIKTNLSPADAAKFEKLPLIEFVTANQRYKVKVRSVIQRVNETTRTQEVRLSLAEGTLIPTGLSGRIEWSNNNLQIPPEYVLRNNGSLGVMTAESAVEGTAKAKFQILPNAIEGQPAQTVLAKSTSIIDKNRYRVTDGQLISIREE